MMNLPPIEKIDKVDRYGNKVSMQYENNRQKKHKVQDRHGNSLTLTFASPDITPPPSMTEVPNYSAKGGNSNNHPGNPKGTDTVPAWLTPGEFVVNKEATQMYEPLIRQMNNHGRQVQNEKAMYASHGSSVDVDWITEDLLDKLRFAEVGNLKPEQMVSPAGARGPYQIMPANFDGGAGFGTTPISAADAFNEEKSRRFAAEYLAGIQNAFPGWSPTEVLQAYNWGPGNMRKYKSGAGNTMPTETTQYPMKILGPGKQYASNTPFKLSDLFGMSAYAADTNKQVPQLAQNNVSDINSIIYGGTQPVDNTVKPAVTNDSPLPDWMKGYHTFGEEVKKDFESTGELPIISESQMVPLSSDKGVELRPSDVKSNEPGLKQDPGMSKEEKSSIVQKIKEQLAAKELEEEEKKKAAEAGANIADGDTGDGDAGAKEMSKAERFLKDLLGPLFNRSELKRMAIFYLGARAMNNTHGDSLAFALENYINRVDSLEEAALRFTYSEQGQKHTDKSLQDFLDNDYDRSLLIEKGSPVRNTAQFVMAYSLKNRNVKRRLEKVEVGTGNNKRTLHRDVKTNTIIPDSFWNDWTTNETYAYGTDKYNAESARLIKLFEDTLKAARNLNSTTVKDRTVKSPYDKLNIPKEAQKMAAFVMQKGPIDAQRKTGVDANLFGAAINNAYSLAMQDAMADEVEFTDLLPYVKYLQFETKTNANPKLFESELDTPTEKKTGVGDPISMREFDTLKEGIVTMMLTMPDPDGEPGSKPFATMDPDTAFNIYVTDTEERWNSLTKNEKGVWRSRALGKGKGKTSGFFEFLRARYLLNIAGDD